MQEPGRRLESWKEIASYFERDVRTVRRWEQHEGLPVHRHLHRARGSVYAFEVDLERWRASRSAPISVDRQRPAGAWVLVAVAAALAGFAVWIIPRSTPLARTPASRVVPVVSAADASGARPDVAAPGWTADSDLREVFLVARHQLERRAGYRREARQSLEAATARTPAYAPGQALLAEAYLREALFDPSRARQAWSQSDAAVHRALSLDPHLAAAHAVQSRILLMRDWNWAAADAESRMAVELDPDAPETRSARALFLRSAGDVAAAIVERQRAQQADPVNPQSLVSLGDEFAFARRYEEALRTYERALALERDYRPAVASLADVCMRLGRHAEAASWQQHWLFLAGRSEVASLFDEVRRRNGPRAALDWLDRWNVRELERAPGEHLWDLAYLHARLGHRETALDYLERAYRRHDMGLLQARVDPDLDTLRDDPRMGDLLARIGPPQ